MAGAGVVTRVFAIDCGNGEVGEAGGDVECEVSAIEAAKSGTAVTPLAGIPVGRIGHAHKGIADRNDESGYTERGLGLKMETLAESESADGLGARRIWKRLLSERGNAKAEAHEERCCELLRGPENAESYEHLADFPEALSFR
jgi:hypothetical protein